MNPTTTLMITGKYVCSECGATDLPALFFIGQFDAVRNKNGRCMDCYQKIRNPQKTLEEKLIDFEGSIGETKNIKHNNFRQNFIAGGTNEVRL